MATPEKQGTRRPGAAPRLPGAHGRAAPLPVLAVFPDVTRPPGGEPALIVSPPDADDGSDRRMRPGAGWRSIAILAVVAAAFCTAAWWVDRGHLDPGAAEIQRLRLAEQDSTTPGAAELPRRGKAMRRR